MRVLENNYNRNNVEDVRKVEKEYPRIRICEYCGSKFEYDKEDMIVGELGCCFTDCPCCGEENLIEDEGVKLTEDNVEFPLHFHHCCKETGAIDICTNEKVREVIKKAIKFFRENKDEFYWFYESGNLHISVTRWDGDECYNVMVTNNYYDTYLNFEEEDY